ncbi:hypothetical protein, partial [Sinorhizobium saheli]|uniref:hypothetical protein n=1 Tax=Sinorhizobium saheli TaxID=36856 RepID=UPI001AEC95B6
KFVCCLAHIGSTFSEVGASGKPGAVQSQVGWRYRDNSYLHPIGQSTNMAASKASRLQSQRA